MPTSLLVNNFSKPGFSCISIEDLSTNDDNTNNSGYITGDKIDKDNICSLSNKTTLITPSTGNYLMLLGETKPLSRQLDQDTIEQYQRFITDNYTGQCMWQYGSDDWQTIEQLSNIEHGITYDSINKATNQDSCESLQAENTSNNQEFIKIQWYYNAQADDEKDNIILAGLYDNMVYAAGLDTSQIMVWCGNWDLRYDGVGNSFGYRCYNNDERNDANWAYYYGKSPKENQWLMPDGITKIADVKGSSDVTDENYTLDTTTSDSKTGICRNCYVVNQLDKNSPIYFAALADAEENSSKSSLVNIDKITTAITDKNPSNKPYTVKIHQERDEINYMAFKISCNISSNQICQNTLNTLEKDSIEDKITENFNKLYPQDQQLVLNSLDKYSWAYQILTNKPVVSGNNRMLATNVMHNFEPNDQDTNSNLGTAGVIWIGGTSACATYSASTAAKDVAPVLLVTDAACYLAVGVVGGVVALADTIGGWFSSIFSSDEQDKAAREKQIAEQKSLDQLYSAIKEMDRLEQAAEVSISAPKLFSGWEKVTFEPNDPGYLVCGKGEGNTRTRSNAMIRKDVEGYMNSIAEIQEISCKDNNSNKTKVTNIKQQKQTRWVYDSHYLGKLFITGGKHLNQHVIALDADNNGSHATNVKNLLTQRFVDNGTNLFDTQYHFSDTAANKLKYAIGNMLDNNAEDLASICVVEYQLNGNTKYYVSTESKKINHRLCAVVIEKQQISKKGMTDWLDTGKKQEIKLLGTTEVQGKGTKYKIAINDPILQFRSRGTDRANLKYDSTGFQKFSKGYINEIKKLYNNTQPSYQYCEGSMNYASWEDVFFRNKIKVEDKKDKIIFQGSDYFSIFPEKTSFFFRDKTKQRITTIKKDLHKKINDTQNAQYGKKCKGKAIRRDILNAWFPDYEDLTSIFVSITNAEGSAVKDSAGVNITGNILARINYQVPAGPDKGAYLANYKSYLNYSRHPATSFTYTTQKATNELQFKHYRETDYFHATDRDNTANCQLDSNGQANNGPFFGVQNLADLNTICIAFVNDLIISGIYHMFKNLLPHNFLSAFEPDGPKDNHAEFVKHVMEIFLRDFNSLTDDVEYQANNKIQLFGSKNERGKCLDNKSQPTFITNHSYGGCDKLNYNFGKKFGLLSAEQVLVTSAGNWNTYYTSMYDVPTAFVDITVQQSWNNNYGWDLDEPILTLLSPFFSAHGRYPGMHIYTQDEFKSGSSFASPAVAAMLAIGHIVVNYIYNQNTLDNYIKIPPVILKQALYYSIGKQAKTPSENNKQLGILGYKYDDASSAKPDINVNPESKYKKDTDQLFAGANQGVFRQTYIETKKLDYDPTYGYGYANLYRFITYLIRYYDSFTNYGVNLNKATYTYSNSAYIGNDSNEIAPFNATLYSAQKSAQEIVPVDYLYKDFSILYSWKPLARLSLNNYDKIHLDDLVLEITPNQFLTTALDSLNQKIDNKKPNIPIYLVAEIQFNNNSIKTVKLPITKYVNISKNPAHPTYKYFISEIKNKAPFLIKLTNLYGYYQVSDLKALEVKLSLQYYDELPFFEKGKAKDANDLININSDDKIKYVATNTNQGYACKIEDIDISYVSCANSDLAVYLFEDFGKNFIDLAHYSETKELTKEINTALNKFENEFILDVYLKYRKKVLPK